MTTKSLTILLGSALCALPACGQGTASGTPATAPTAPAAGAPGEAAPAKPADATPAKPAEKPGKAGAEAPTPHGAAVVDGGDSPDDVVKRAQAAVKARDLGGIIRLATPKERLQMGAGLLMMTKMLPAMKQMMTQLAQAPAVEGAKKPDLAEFDTMCTELEAVTKKYNVQVPEGAGDGGKPDEAAIEKAFGSVDIAGFVSDVFGVMSKHKDAMPQKGPDPFEGMAAKMTGTLTDLKIDGDKASGKIGKEPAAFVRVGGRWYAVMEGGRQHRGKAEAEGDAEGEGEEKEAGEGAK